MTLDRLETGYELIADLDAGGITVLDVVRAQADDAVATVRNFRIVGRPELEGDRWQATVADFAMVADAVPVRDEEALLPCC